jgi:alkylation response protein AidB-like acyl-CoA dehydrogenase
MKTGIPGPEGSVAKLHWSESNQRLTKLALEILGSDAQVVDLDDGAWQYQQLRSRGNTIEAGTSEILRNIIAERVLGLPRGR